MTADVYVYPESGRMGFGEILIPWARCEIFRQKWHAPMLAPRWMMGPKLGRLFRRGKDKGDYHGYIKKEGYVTGFSRLAVLLGARRIFERDFVPGAEDATGGGRKTLVVFSGIEGMFQPLLAHRQMIRHRLLEMLSPGLRRQLARQQTDFVIGVHVERGADQPATRARESRSHGGTPDEWFIRCIQNLRKMLGFAAPVQIFSDARRHQLKALLALPNVKLAPDNPSIVDLLMLARSRILVTSAKSTFSMWAAYLGQMPSLWYPGELPDLDPEKPYLECQTDLDGHFSGDFGAVIDSLNLALNP